MTKTLKAFKLTEKNIATIEQHMEFIRCDNVSQALRDILDNAHIYQSWRDREIMKLWFGLGNLGVRESNVQFVIPLVKRGYSRQELRGKKRKASDKELPWCDPYTKPD